MKFPAAVILLFAGLVLGFIAGYTCPFGREKVEEETTIPITAAASRIWSDTLQIWFNHESQGEAIKKQGKHEFYDLIFFYGTDTGKAAENSGKLVKCRLNAEYVEGYVSKKYMGELTVPSNKCQNLKP